MALPIITVPPARPYHPNRDNGDSSIPPSQYLRDSSGGLWFKVGDAMLMTAAGVTAEQGQGSKLMLYVGSIWLLALNGLWYRWTGDRWVEPSPEHPVDR